MAYDSTDSTVQSLDFRRLVEQLDLRIRQLESENSELREQLVAVTAQKNAALDKLEQLQKEAARSAAPFRRRDAQKISPKEHKRPGRPVGHPGVNRPIPARIDHEITVPLACCPHCQGSVSDCQNHTQYIEEIPVVTPQVTKLITQSGTCAKCGPVRSTHPLQAGRGKHASACQLGPRALALAATLNKQHGLSMRKTCKVLFDACGLKLSPGGLSQALDRIADRLEPDYQQLFRDVRAGPAVYVDETSWWVGGPGYWLWTFTSPTTTLYQVRDSRGSAVVLDVLTLDYQGVLITDCLNIYDRGVPYERKHKCITHHQKAIREQLDSPGLRDRTYLEAWRGLFQLVCELTANRELLGERTFAYHRSRCVAKRDQLLAYEVTQEQDRRIQNRLEKQRDFLLTCLMHPEVEATNNRAERSLRPAVIARKVSCGNKTTRGKHTWEILASLFTTWTQRGLHNLTYLASRFRTH
jgi:transposase